MVGKEKRKEIDNLILKMYICLCIKVDCSFAIL